MRRALTLDAADSKALDEVFLQEGIQDDDGQGGNNDNGRLDGNTQGGFIRRACTIANHGSAVDNVAQEQHNGVLLLIEVDQRIEPVVPEEHRIIQADRCNSSGGKRHNDAAQNAPIAQAVNKSSFLQLVRERFERVDHDDQVELADAEGQQHSPAGAGQVQRGYQQVVGDHAAGKKHRDNNDLHEKLVAHQVVFGQGIGEHDRHQHSDGSTADGINKGIAICLEKVGVGEDLPVSIQIKADWPEQDLVVDDGLGTGEGQRCHIHKRQKADKQGKDHDQVDNGVKNDVFFCFIILAHLFASLNTGFRPSAFC